MEHAPDWSKADWSQSKEEIAAAVGVTVRSVTARMEKRAETILITHPIPRSAAHRILRSLLEDSSFFERRGDTRTSAAYRQTAEAIDHALKNQPETP